MARFQKVLLILQVIQVFVDAAPSEVSQLEKIAKVENADSKLDVPVTLDEASKTSNSVIQGQRQKRFYDFYGFGYPPMNPLIYGNQNGYGPEDPFSQIYRRLQGIAGVVRNPTYNQPPPPPPIPVLFPILYIPQVGCGCTPPRPPRRNGTNTDPGVETRFPEMDDVRQNWGFVVNPNDTEPDDGQEEDFTRPISFVPIVPIRPTSRPPPPVDRGTNQGGGRDGTTTTTVRPSNQYPPPAAAAPPPQSPTNCDAAVLSCCHQLQATYDCFVVQGCPDPTAYGNPCDSQVILSVIDKFARFYGTRNS